MKKLLVISLIVLVMASLLVAAGCGESDDTDTGKGETEVTLPVGGGGEEEEVEEGAEAEYAVNGTYESAEGTFITLMVDGTFETDAWGGMKEGTWLYTEDEMGKWVDLAFEDGSSISMSVMIGMDEVAAVVDMDTGIQYTKK